MKIIIKKSKKMQPAEPAEPTEYTEPEVVKNKGGRPRKSIEEKKATKKRTNDIYYARAKSNREVLKKLKGLL
jgi:hypothetical protein